MNFAKLHDDVLARFAKENGHEPTEGNKAAATWLVGVLETTWELGLTHAREGRPPFGVECFRQASELLMSEMGKPESPELTGLLHRYYLDAMDAVPQLNQ